MMECSEAARFEIRPAKRDTAILHSSFFTFHSYQSRPSHIVYGNTECGGRFAVRRGRCGLWGFAAIGAGLFILLALVLPAEFWWFFLAAGLIGLGVWYLRCCT